MEYDDVKFKVLPDIPMLSISEIKFAPMSGFEEAKDNGTGVYISNRNDIVGVMLTRDQYESLIHELNELREVAKHIID